MLNIYFNCFDKLEWINRSSMAYILDNKYKWKEEEKLNIVKGVQEFGRDFKYILNILCFHPTRTIQSLKRKYYSMEISGKYHEYLSKTPISNEQSVSGVIFNISTNIVMLFYSNAILVRRLST